MEAKIEANNEQFQVLLGTLVSRVDIHQARREANQWEMTAKMAAWIERTEACVAKLVANRVKPDAVEVHPEVPDEEAEVENRYGDRHLAVGRRQQPKKRTQGDGGSRKKLAAVRRLMTRRAVSARR
jgi:hypothetical protein